MGCSALPSGRQEGKALPTWSGWLLHPRVHLGTNGLDIPEDESSRNHLSTSQISCFVPAAPSADNSSSCGRVASLPGEGGFEDPDSSAADCRKQQRNLLCSHGKLPLAYQLVSRS